MWWGEQAKTSEFSENSEVLLAPSRRHCEEGVFSDEAISSPSLVRHFRARFFECPPEIQRLVNLRVKIIIRFAHCALCIILARFRISEQQRTEFQNQGSERAQRKPMTRLTALTGVLPYRSEERTKLSLRFHEPPRSTREPLADKSSRPSLEL